MTDKQAPIPAERFIVFACEGDFCVGILAQPDPSTQRLDVGTVIVVGGPQYRVGSHRQFVSLSRALARAGIPTLRFDYRGMGDSEGNIRSFESIDLDISAAVDALCGETGINRVVLWGLCDGASAALMYGSTDQRVVGLAMANVWARTPQIQASARLKHYYVRRLISASFWRNVVCGRIAVRASFTDFARDMRMSQTKPTERYLDRMDEAFRRFRRPVLFILSGEDQGAREFEEWVGRNDMRVDLFRSSASEVFRVNGADHTFSRSEWCDAVSSKTIEWIHDSVVPGVER